MARLKLPGENLSCSDTYAGAYDFHSQMAKYKDHLFVPRGGWGVCIIDVSDPKSPKLLETIEQVHADYFSYGSEFIAACSLDTYVDGAGKAWLCTAGRYGAYTFDLSALPAVAYEGVLVAAWDLRECLWRVNVVHDVLTGKELAYVIGWDGLRVLDVSNPVGKDELPSAD